MIDGISNATWGTAKDGAAVSLTFEVDGDSVPGRWHRIEALIKDGDVEAARRGCLLAAKSVQDIRSGKAAADILAAWRDVATFLRADVDRLRAALKEIAEDPCIDPEGNRQIALRALGKEH